MMFSKTFAMSNSLDTLSYTTLFMHLIAVLGAYSFFDKKPAIGVS
jgi:hypothetical protein